MVNRLIEPTSGHIYVNGQETDQIKPDKLRRYIGYAIQNVGLFPHMTVAANIAVVPKLLRWKKRRISERVEELLTLVGLDPGEYARKYPNQLSGGEAQRIGVARALAADPPVLLMDEPFGAVDPLTRERLQAQFARIQQELKKTVILVTHDLDEAIRLADRIAIMNSGKLVQYDTPEIILSKPADKFVHDFVGTDRALKRLSRINIEGYLKPAPSINVKTPIQEAVASLDTLLYLWVVDDQNHLLGWLDRRSINKSVSVEQSLVGTDLADMAIRSGSTLREALSRMLGLGFKFVPVIDESERLIGELSLRDIEAATSEFEN
jgi:osmoprotectant transport system ATP-binding protein